MLKRKAMIALGGFAVLLACHAAPAVADTKKLVMGAPGIPPIFAASPVIIADKGGFFGKFGDVELRWFDNGAAAARAVAAGDIDFALSPSVLLANQISNAGVNLVGIYGMPHPDFLLGSTDARKASCKDVIGQPVGVDTPGGQRSLMLKEMLLSCDVGINQVQQVSLGSNSAAAMIAGSLTFATLHIDDKSAIEAQGMKVTVITTITKANPKAHNILGVARLDRVAQYRPSFVGLLAGLMAATRYMKDPKNADKVAELLTVNGRPQAENRKALEGYLAIDAWPSEANDDGMDRRQLDHMIQNQVKIGGILPGKEPVTYERLVDRSLWRDAAALLAKP